VRHECQTRRGNEQQQQQTCTLRFTLGSLKGAGGEARAAGVELMAMLGCGGRQCTGSESVKGKVR
jgi:hypothetical protein